MAALLGILIVPLGAWLVVAPWVLDGAGRAAAIASVVAGLAVVALALPRGAIRSRYGDWGRWIR